MGKVKASVISTYHKPEYSWPGGDILRMEYLEVEHDLSPAELEYICEAGRCPFCGHLEIMHSDNVMGASQWCTFCKGGKC